MFPVLAFLPLGSLPAPVFHSPAHWVLFSVSWRIHSTKAVHTSGNMWSLISLIFSHFESMPRHQPCLLLSERHQPNSHWCAIIIAQMAMRFERDRQSKEMKTEWGGVRRKTGRQRATEWCFLFSQQQHCFLNVAKSKSHIPVMTTRLYTKTQMCTLANLHSECLTRLIQEDFSCQGKSCSIAQKALTPPLIHWLLLCLLLSHRGSLGVTETCVFFCVARCMCPSSWLLGPWRMTVSQRGKIHFLQVLSV